jgi:CRP-like cAMP-binding protein
MDRHESYSQAPIFTSLEAAEIADLLDVTEEIRAEPGDVLLTQGELGRGLFLVASGRFAVRREGLAEPLASLGDLAHFGDVSLITNSPASASVV